MQTRIITGSLLGLWLAIGSAARADLAPPLPPAKDSVAIKIEVDEKAKGPKLILPSGVITPARGPRPVPPNIKGELPEETTDAVATEEQPQKHHIFAGIALALSISFAGIWLARRGGRVTGRTIAIFGALGGTLVVGGLLWANAPPPVRPVPPKAQALPVLFDGKTEVQFVFGQEPIRLIVDKETAEKLMKGAKPAVQPAPTGAPNSPNVGSAPPKP